MREIVLFAEDYGHEEFLKSLLSRFADENGIAVAIQGLSVRGGHGKVVSEFRQFMKDLRRAQKHLPDLLVVASDANCKGLMELRKEIEEVIDEEMKSFVIHAIPDPHIERWLLLDPAAFKTVLGRGCKAPDLKCSRDRYKKALLDEMQDARVSPPLGGIEYAHDIVAAMDLKAVEHADPSIKQLIRDLRSKFNKWKC